MPFQNLPRHKPRPIALLETTRGTITLVLYPEVTPKSVAAFVEQAKRGRFNGKPFTALAPQLLGCGTAQGGPVPAEKNGLLRHNRGAVALSGLGQFYIVVQRPTPERDALAPDGSSLYPVVGQVVSGQAIAEKLKPGDVLKKATIKD